MTRPATRAEQAAALRVLLLLGGGVCTLAIALVPQTCSTPARLAPLPAVSPRLQLTPEGTYHADTCWRVAGPKPVPCWAFPLDPERDARHLPPRLFTERTA